MSTETVSIDGSNIFRTQQRDNQLCGRWRYPLTLTQDRLSLTNDAGNCLPTLKEIQREMQAK